ncbi:MAG: dephospho-CoA kinase [Deltaproteobacteria bacterium]|nr:dephospho-CoA kinase [Deltaproteobacteria bacterium]MBW2394236.1 dephospho-CoA kinase [Deltaproteobacteria bacterium]
MARVVGLTGGIGTGKSTVARLLTERGAELVDADAIVRQLQAPGMPMLAEIAKAFGDDMLLADGSLDRKRLGKKVFADPEARTRLGLITGPPIVAELLKQIDAKRRSNAPLVIVDIPLLFEGRGAAAYGLDGVILVYAKEEQQISRQIERDGATPEHALQRVRAQLPIEEKRALADHVIDNSGPPTETEAQTNALYHLLTT